MTLPNQNPAALARFHEGVAHLTAGATAQAEACFRAAIGLAPALAEAHANLGLLLDQRGESAPAEASYRAALALQPKLQPVWLNLGVLLGAQRRGAEAAACYREALRLRPDDAAGWTNLGMLHACEKREEEAEACYRRALTLDPQRESTQFNLSYLLLRQGRFEEGWQRLEARAWYPAFAAALPCPRWHGEALTGKAILITCEAGHGDMIQFCRYATELKARGAARVSVLCHPALKRLFASLTDADEILALGKDVVVSPWDFWVPAMSLAYHCATRLDSIPARIPYLHATAADTAHWATRLPPAGRRVGLVWKGSAGFENDAERSQRHLDALAPLWTVAGVHFISLQKGPGEAEAQACARPLAILGPELEDFADTAGVLANLDLVISVDTAVAHLAGALGVPCWLLLPDYKTDWRWLSGREDSPWYPLGMRLFRQAPPGDWTTTIARVASALAEWVRTQPGHATGS